MRRLIRLGRNRESGSDSDRFYFEDRSDSSDDEMQAPVLRRRQHIIDDAEDEQGPDIDHVHHHGDAHSPKTVDDTESGAASCEERDSPPRKRRRQPIHLSKIVDDPEVAAGGSQVPTPGSPMAAELTNWAEKEDSPPKAGRRRSAKVMNAGASSGSPELKKGRQGGPYNEL